MKNHIKLIIALVILAILVYLLFVFDIPRAKVPDNVGDSFSTTTPLEMVRVETPVASSTVSSPLTVSGEARGYWYFEASFPIKIIDANGAELGAGVAQAKGNWMTTEFVPFTATVAFQNNGSKTGFLRFVKDNPSGIKNLDMHLDIPIKF